MKERVTFIHAPGADLDPKLLKVSKAGLAGPTIKTTREDRLTIPLEELPPGIQQTLVQLSHLNVRWSSPRLYDTEEAFSARASPGFHVSLAQARVPGLIGDESLPIKQVQMMLRVFEKCGIKDHNSFSKLKIESDPDTDYYYFWQPMDTLQSFGKASGDVFCDKQDEACKARMHSFGDASTLDVKYDSISRTAKLSIMWSPSEQSLDVAANKKRRVEVGILEQGSATNQESHESGLSGLLTVLGENKEPSPVLFNFPARHRKTADTFTASFPPPTGIHPTLKLTVSSSTSPNPDGKCSPYAYLTLPNVIFADRYQLADSLFLASKNLAGTPQISTPVDLEAPAYNTTTWGSNALIQLAPPKDADGAFTSEIPLHLRYVAPKDSGGQAIELPYPVVFWACDPVADADFSKSPFDNAHLGYDDLFPQGTTFWHVNPQPESGERITSQLVVPALEEKAASTIELGTAAVVILGFTWVLWKVIRGVVANGYGTKATVKEDKKKK